MSRQSARSAGRTSSRKLRVVVDLRPGAARLPDRRDQRPVVAVVQVGADGAVRGDLVGHRRTHAVAEQRQRPVEVRLQGGVDLVREGRKAGGRTAASVPAWIGTRTRRWRAGVQVVAIGMRTVFKAAVRDSPRSRPASPTPFIFTRTPCKSRIAEPRSEYA